MLVEAGFFGREELLSLKEAARKMSPRYTAQTLWNWHAQGNLNQSGDHVYLRVTPINGRLHTSLAELARHLQAITTHTLEVEVIGGSLHGARVKINDSDEPLTAGDLADQLTGRIVPAQEVYEPRRFIDVHGQPRTFLIFQKDLEAGAQAAIEKLRSE